MRLDQDFLSSSTVEDCYVLSVAKTRGSILVVVSSWCVTPIVSISVELCSELSE